ncbi:hypothetical protein [Pantoea sp. B65]|uniref:hypothetical protein n=1 Tax=Pantoea sp. B65 TaxID=2813359 RepID=UPI0039B38DD9
MGDSFSSGLGFMPVNGFYSVNTRLPETCPITFFRFFTAPQTLCLSSSAIAAAGWEKLVHQSAGHHLILLT